LPAPIRPRCCLCWWAGWRCGRLAIASRGAARSKSRRGRR
jgi:hypothetical protein